MGVSREEKGLQAKFWRSSRCQIFSEGNFEKKASVVDREASTLVDEDFFGF